MVSIACAVDIMRGYKPMPEIRDNGEDLHWYYYQCDSARKIRELTPRELHVEIEVLYHLDHSERQQVTGHEQAFQALCFIHGDFDRFGNTLFPELMPVYCAMLRAKQMPHWLSSEWLKFDNEANCARSLQLAEAASPAWLASCRVARLRRDMSLEQTRQLCAIFPSLTIDKFVDGGIRPLGDVLHLVAMLPHRFVLEKGAGAWLREIINARRIFALIVATSGGHMRIRPLPNWWRRSIPAHRAHNYLEWLLQRAHTSFFEICARLPLELQERIAQYFLPSERDLGWGPAPTTFAIGSDELTWLRQPPGGL